MTSNRIRLIIYVALIATLGGSARALCETTEFPVARDLWVSSAGGEEHGNNGGAPRLKLKGYQEFSLLDFDLDSLRGKKIKSARLLVTLAGEERLYRTAVGTISEEWTEGTGANYERQDGSSSFAMRAEPDVPWFTSSDFLNARGEYSDLTSVIFSEGGSIWSHADVAKPSEGRQMIEVAPEIVTSRLYGFSYGFVLFDDQGTELKRDGDNVEIRLFPNRFLYSREQNKATQPYLYVEYEDPSERELAIMPVRHAGNTLVWHVITPRGEDESAAAGEVRVLGDRQAVQEILKYSEEFNRLAEKTEPVERKPLPEETDDPLLQRMQDVYDAASCLTRQNARQYRRILAVLAAVSALIAMSFLLYDEAEAFGLILVIGLLLLLAWLCQRYAGRSACLRRYIEYRALAECLRVSIYLRYAGSGIRAENLLSWTQQVETAWILDALCALRAGCPPEKKHDIRECWVEEQRAYHRAGGEKTLQHSRFSDRIVRTALRLSVLLYLLALLFELFCGGELTTPLLPAANAEGWRTVLKIVMGSISAVTLFVANYYGRLSLPRVLSDHGKMERFFARMSERLQEEGQTDALLTALAREELIENGNWCSYQRDNAPEISL